MLILDIIWLKSMGGTFFDKHAGQALRTTPIVWSAAACYILMAAGIYYFVARHLPAKESYGQAFTQAALLGLLVYGVFDFTSHAIFKFWPARAILLDITWGAFLFGTTLCIQIFIKRQFSI